MKITKEQFRQTEDCQLCGTQRCDGSDEMMDYCFKWISLNLQGLCKTCYWSFVCDDAKRFLNMEYCNKYIKSREKSEL